LLLEVFLVPLVKESTRIHHMQDWGKMIMEHHSNGLPAREFIRQHNVKEGSYYCCSFCKHLENVRFNSWTLRKRLGIYPISISAAHPTSCI